MTRLASFAAAALSAVALAALATASGTAAASGTGAESAAARPSPLDPAAPVTALPDGQGLAGGYRPLPALEPLPWRRLFDARGEFVDHDRSAPAPQAPRAPLAQAPAPAGPAHGADPAAAEAVPAGADAVATVLRIDRDAQRVRLRHGPIRKLEMPGMTMLFQVADPALLDAVAVGETIGFRIEQRGQAFVITDWVREGAK